MILRDEADIAVSSFFATRDRGEVVDFSVIMEYAEFWLSPYPPGKSKYFKHFQE